MIDINTVFLLKTELLSKGLYLDEGLIKHYKNHGIDYGRKGGAGPLGGKYFILEDNKTLVNVALWNNFKATNLILKRKNRTFFEVFDRFSHDFHSNLILVMDPKYYDPKYKTTDGVPMKKIALVHGIDCLATTTYQKCKYWACGEACKFCGIELSLSQETTILEKNYRQINEVIAAAKIENRCSHITLTSGTEMGEDKGANRYIEILKEIKNEYPKLPLHVQIEPFENNLEYINKLKEAGADTIGIHVEITDENIRKKVTPGKSKIPYKIFEENWQHAVEIFGKNQVETFILTGFGESPVELLRDIEKIISLGVIPFITPVRAIPGVKATYSVLDSAVLLKIYNEVAKMMKNYGLNPLDNKAGCVKCGGCSAINEAYKAL